MSPYHKLSVGSCPAAEQLIRDGLHIIVLHRRMWERRELVAQGKAPLAGVGILQEEDCLKLREDRCFPCRTITPLPEDGAGEISFDTEGIGDYIIAKSDGFHLQFAVVWMMPIWA